MAAVVMCAVVVVAVVVSEAYPSTLQSELVEEASEQLTVVGDVLLLRIVVKVAGET